MSCQALLQTHTLTCVPWLSLSVIHTPQPFVAFPGKTWGAGADTSCSESSLCLRLDVCSSRSIQEVEGVIGAVVQQVQLFPGLPSCWPPGTEGCAALQCLPTGVVCQLEVLHDQPVEVVTMEY
jgi:hypothetical protein